MKNAENYKIRGTKVTSPYPIQLTPAEHRLVFSLQHIFAPENILPDCYFPKVDFRHSHIYDRRKANFDLATLRNLPGSEVAQIDCIAFGPKGVFVFESKDFGGWIYGTGIQRYWTQTLNFGQEKHQFYNPIRQNASHIAALSELFPPSTPIYSIIVFGSDTVLKSITNLPTNCHVVLQPALRSLISSILARPSARELSVAELTSLRANLQAARILPTTAIRNEHISALQEK